jgi:hypothetical protein
MKQSENDEKSEAFIEKVSAVEGSAARVSPSIADQSAEASHTEQDGAHPPRTESEEASSEGSTARVSPSLADLPDEALMGKSVEPAKEPTARSTKDATCWVVHSGYDHGDVRLLREHGFQVQHHERWFDYGDAHKCDSRLRRLKQDKPGLLLIYMAAVPRNAQPRASLRTTIEQVCAVVLEQMKSGRHVIVYGYNYESTLWATRHPEHRGPDNWGPLADEEHPLFPLQSFVCV